MFLSVHVLMVHGLTSEKILYPFGSSKIFMLQIYTSDFFLVSEQHDRRT